MDILLRDIDPRYITELERQADDLSKRAGRKFSRNEYIKMLLERDSLSRLEDIAEDKFDRSLQDITFVLERHTASLQEYIDTNSRIVLVLMKQLDVDFEELAEALDD